MDHILTTERLGEVPALQAQSSGEIKLAPETLVLCINRGREPLFDKFDSRDYAIPTGFFTLRFDAANHFKARAVVPGSRNPESNFQASFIAIIGVVAPVADGFKVLKAIDAPHEWEPFTDDECREYGHALEALDRAGMSDAINPDVELRSVRGGGNTGVIPPSRVKGGGHGGRRSTQIVGDGTSALKVKNRPGHNEATDAIDADTRGRRAEKD